ncbi:transporter [Phenylobacterium hankyongense]|uniref:transporter n=1 Tax=Phenylobacterium hankyongense TaxID=1813876 RepID=UPI0010578EEC|nr:transporter [Phenylobacterium hankyongense]
MTSWISWPRAARALALGLLASATFSAAAKAQAAAPEATSPESANPGARPLCADRPGKATPPCIVDVGRLQVEVGLVDAAFQRQAGQHDDAYTLGQFELRTGISRRTEVEIGWTPWSIQRTETAGVRSRQAGVGDLSLGFRTALTDPDKDGLAVSLEPFVTAPTGTHGQGAGGWQGGLLLPMSGPLIKDVSFGFTPEVAVVRNAAGGGTHVAWSGAFGISHAFGPANVGLEVWGGVDEDPAATTTMASLDATAAWTPAATPDLQLDAGVNAGLNRNTPDVELYVGVARRF